MAGKAGLATYHKKRHFGVTAEPKGKVVRRRGHAYVIQKHDATRLHYDLRLELDGVMKSWAVTRGPSLVPGEKRLAVQVEDHPVEYNTFEGTIPKGEYGGGTVMIWDRGSWEPQNDPHKGLAKGHLDFVLHGNKLKGGWHLVRMHRRPGEKRDNWLLIKQHDEAERSARAKDILEEQPLSVASGRSMDEIANRSRKVWHSDRAKNSVKPSAFVKTGTSATNDASFAGARKGALPAFVPPALATLVEKVPSGDRWIHEIKFDGYRIQARLDRGKIKLLTRKGLDWTKKFPTVAAAVAKLPAMAALIDGELVSEDKDGISRFSLLQQDLKESRHDRMVLYAFDLLHLDGHDLRPLPLTARKAALEKLLGKRREALRFSESLTEPGPSLFDHACAMGLEGIVSKLAEAPYRSGRGHEWLKAKCSDRQEFVVAGFAPSSADARAVGALVLGVYDHGKLRYAGRTGTGFTRDTAHALYRRLATLRQKNSPIAPVPKEERGKHAPIWVEPKLVAEVDFRGWTHGERVRQASFQGLREDKPAKDVVREVKAGTTVAAAAPATIVRSAILTTRNAATAGQVKLTHPDRVYWEDVGITKRDLADYYTKVWKWMQPHVVGRPLALVRCPDGIQGHCFFQKHAHTGIPGEFLRLVSEKGDKIIAIDDLDGLYALVQGGVLEIHTRGTTIADRERGDRLVFDLDPGPGTTWADVVEAAREVRTRLAGIKLETFVKTSGGKGLHVVLPIKPEPWETVKEFCRAVAESMEMDEPDRYVSTAAKSRRTGRIFIDYLRNSREATAVAPYSTRARPGAAVSMPVAWSELGSLTSADHYTVENAVKRLSKLRKDPWAEIGRCRQALPKFK